MTTGRSRMLAKKNAFKKFKKVYGRKPTKMEIMSFDTGFNMGWADGKLRERKLTKDYLITCSCCGEKYDSEGYNVNEESRIGNNYRYCGEDRYHIKYTTCTKCKNRVIITKNKFVELVKNDM